MTVRDHFERYTADFRRPADLGHSTIAHERLGYCHLCFADRDLGAIHELSAWRLLAMAEAEEAQEQRA